MNIRRLIRVPKSVVTPGKWKCAAVDPQQKMGPKAFDFGSRRPFQIGKNWWWRVDKLDCNGTPGKLLIAFHLEKENYLAWLMISRDGSPVVAACLEHHGTHPGWHYHSRCGSIAEFMPNVQRQRNEGVRIPRSDRYHRPRAYRMSQLEAINRAYGAFRIGKKKEGEWL